MDIIKVDPDILEDSGAILTYVGAALRADDVAYQEVWMRYAAATSDLPTDVWIRTSATSAAAQYTSLAGTAMDYAAVIRALDRDGNDRIAEGEADVFLLEAALAERAADPEATSSLLRDRATKRVAADAAAERLSRYDGREPPYDQAEVDQLRADLDAIKAYADVAADPLAEETRLLETIGARDYLAMSLILQSARPTIGPPEDPTGRIEGDEYLAYLAGWTSRALEDQPERIDHWIETLDSTTSGPSNTSSPNHIALVLLATESDKDTSALASAIWDLEKHRDRLPLSDPAYNLLWDLYGVHNPSVAIVAAAGHRAELARYVLGDLLDPEDGAFSMDDLMGSGVSYVNDLDADVARFITTATIGRGKDPHPSLANSRAMVAWVNETSLDTLQLGGPKTGAALGRSLQPAYTEMTGDGEDHVDAPGGRYRKTLDATSKLAKVDGAQQGMNDALQAIIQEKIPTITTGPDWDSELVTNSLDALGKVLNEIQASVGKGEIDAINDKIRVPGGMSALVTFGLTKGVTSKAPALGTLIEAYEAYEGKPVEGAKGAADDSFGLAAVADNQLLTSYVINHPDMDPKLAAYVNEVVATHGPSGVTRIIDGVDPLTGNEYLGRLDTLEKRYPGLEAMVAKLGDQRVDLDLELGDVVNKLGG